MKKNKYQYRLLLGLVILLLCLTSCAHFFDESSQDEIRPSSVADIKAMMYKEAYPYLFTSSTYLDLLTDEIQCNGLSYATYAPQHKAGTPIFTFDQTMFDAVNIIPDESNSWKLLYEKIMGCNVVKDYLPKVSGTDTEKNALLGQVLFLRAYYYLKLALIYCQPYNGKNINPDTAMGLPLQLTMTVSDNFPSRSTLRDTYVQIEKDLLESVALLKDNYKADSQFRVDQLAANILLSRLYLYMGRTEDMANVVKYADVAMAQGPALTTFASMKSGKGVYDIDVSSEVVWVYGSPSSLNETFFIPQPTDPYQPPYTVSATLMSLYGTNDLRLTSFFNNRNLYSYKKGTQNTNYGDCGIRMAEVYLNRAEALIREYKIDGDAAKCTQALNDLNTLRRSRYTSQTYTDINITDPDALLTFCLQERQRELCMEEGFRWFDIKRLGLSVSHHYIDTDGNAKDYTLEPNSLLYALPIPYDAIDRNNKLVQNPR